VRVDTRHTAFSGSRARVQLPPALGLSRSLKHPFAHHNWSRRSPFLAIPPCRYPPRCLPFFPMIDPRGSVVNQQITDYTRMCRNHSSLFPLGLLGPWRNPRRRNPVIQCRLDPGFLGLPQFSSNSGRRIPSTLDRGEFRGNIVPSRSEPWTPRMMILGQKPRPYAPIVGADSSSFSHLQIQAVLFFRTSRQDD